MKDGSKFKGNKGESFTLSLTGKKTNGLSDSDGKPAFAQLLKKHVELSPKQHPLSNHCGQGGNPNSNSKDLEFGIVSLGMPHPSCAPHACQSALEFEILNFELSSWEYLTSHHAKVHWYLEFGIWNLESGRIPNSNSKGFDLLVTVRSYGPTIPRRQFQTPNPWS